jgi:hypothetical protein
MIKILLQKRRLIEFGQMHTEGRSGTNIAKSFRLAQGGCTEMTSRHLAFWSFAT